jgi:hypothetical protein
MEQGGDGIARQTTSDMVWHELVGRLVAMGSNYTEGDQVKPVAILWPDGDRLWIGLIEELRTVLPELFILGPIDPAGRSGPAIWLRCVEARTVETAYPPDAVPIFYLPGVSRQQLRAVEECPALIEPLVELQFRGVVWSHPNGKDWTPLAFLSSRHGGLGLEVANDAESQEALQRALPALMRDRLVNLAGKKLDADFLNSILTPDLPVEILRWMNDPKGVRKFKSGAEWEAFSAQCCTEYRLRPEKDGPLRAANLLGNREGAWGKVWTRFAEAPVRYPGVVTLLERAAPASGGMLAFDREYWPTFNARDEELLAKSLLELKDKSGADAAKAIMELERSHGARRDWVWRMVGQAPLAVALEHLSLLATLTRKPLAAADPAAMADLYMETGWEADAAAAGALAAADSPSAEEAIATAVRVLYLPWLEESARNLQTFAAKWPEAMRPRQASPDTADGRVVLFVDGLRMDLAHGVIRKLRPMGFEAGLAWDWAAFPTVTPTGKTAVSPMAAVLAGGGPEEEFAPSLAGTEKRWTADRFRAFLKEQGVQILEGRDCGDPGGRAWTEAGALDSRGHNEGIKSAKTLVQEVRDIAGRIGELLESGWREVVVVTDHGWLLVPGGLPKVNLSHFVVEHRWGRCAAVKMTAATDLPSLPWHWNPEVTIATPPGVGSFRAGLEYAHGGISAQEMVVPRLTVRAGTAAKGQTKITGLKWIGLRCRVSIENSAPGLTADIRGRAADSASSKVDGGRPREVGVDGTVSLPIADDREIGNAAVVVLTGPDGSVLASMPTVIGDNP